MKKILLGILLFVFGLAAGLMITKTPFVFNPSPATTPTTTISPTTNWKTYKIPQTQVSFKYPGNLEYIEFSDKSVVFLITKTLWRFANRIWQVKLQKCFFKKVSTIHVLNFYLNLTL